MMARNCPAQANSKEVASAEACCGHVPLAGGAAGTWGVLGAPQNITSKCCPAATLLPWPRPDRHQPSPAVLAQMGSHQGLQARLCSAPAGPRRTRDAALCKQPDNSNQTTRPKGHKDPENQVFYQKIPRKGFFSASYQLKHVGQKR